MAKLVWDQTGSRYYETGVDRGVFYPLGVSGEYTPGVAWNGLSNVSESPSGAEATPIYADNIKYLSLTSAEDFGLTIEAYSYPPEFGVCDGSAEPTEGVTVAQQDRKTFGFSYRTMIGNDAEGNEHGYKIHLVYGCKAAPSEKSYGTISDSPEAITMSWEISTTPVNVTGFKPTAHLVIDSTRVSAAALTAIETILYGDTSTEAKLPLPDDVITAIKGASA